MGLFQVRTIPGTPWGRVTFNKTALVLCGKKSANAHLLIKFKLKRLQQVYTISDDFPLSFLNTELLPS